MKKNGLRIGLAILICAVLVVILAARGYYYHYYPYGSRAAKLSTFRLALMEYADEHDGWYPKGASNSFECLQKLYPAYAPGGGQALAGLSGNESRTVMLLEQHKPLDAEASSWVYWPGFRKDDDEHLAIIWEREEGLFFTGTRASGHAVAFAQGGYEQIPIEKWAEFLKEQEALRKSVLAKRSGAAEKP